MKPGSNCNYRSSSCVQPSSSQEFYRNMDYRKTLYYQAGCSFYGKPYTSYDSSCITTCSGGITNPNSNACYKKAILAASDSMLGLSYVAGCAYITDVALDVIKTRGACDKMGD